MQCSIRSIASLRSAGLSTRAASPIASTSSAILFPTAPARRSGRGCTCRMMSSSGSSRSSYPGVVVTPPPTQKEISAAPRRKRTILDIHNLKKKGIPVTMLTAHDFASARFIENSYTSSPNSTSSSSSLSPASIKDDTTLILPKPLTRGIDMCLIGDSLAMVACGYTSTTSLTLDELLYHCRSVARGCTTSLLVSDMPFGTFINSTSDGVKNAIRIIQEGNMDAVKIEGGLEIVGLVKRLTSVGIPVMGHVGLTPQRAGALSGFRVQGKTAESAKQVLEDALAIEAAGAFSIVLEAVPVPLATYITSRLSIPTIGIGAGPSTSGQVLVQLDMLGVNSFGKAGKGGPKFLKKFAELEGIATDAVGEYVREVREGTFPESVKHGYAMADEEWDGFMKMMEAEGKK